MITGWENSEMWTDFTQILEEQVKLHVETKE